MFRCVCAHVCVCLRPHKSGGQISTLSVIFQETVHFEFEDRGLLTLTWNNAEAGLARCPKVLQAPLPGAGTISTHHQVPYFYVGFGDKTQVLVPTRCTLC